ncbi:T9SS type A sorting domain-containing protein [Formosa sp. PL04]|uniref:T9SS type A sorting domain-containing protein n=1 Tax=Formosa sp. PL04 TaxID=3081755 RepID=UPI0029823692|nr:T9SS type A sorting domain-containing protein [Formosa sp. PL04]MDW5288056.1 family 16 glycosylhydrolase [Formosa sp. PL04]
MQTTLLIYQPKTYLKESLYLFLFLFIFSEMQAQVYPLSDQSNSGNWVLNETVSDEFDTDALDKAKWNIQGEDNVYKSNFIGRAPSQFSTKNGVVDNDKLKIQTKWEPDFDFSETPQDGVKYENITTAAVISKAQFHYGYMEIKCKSADAEITSSFWTTGNKSELDMFEMFGGPKEANQNWKKRLKYNMISWDPENYYYLPDGKGPAYTDNIQVEENTADDFHVYGFDWTPDYIKIYVDGVLHPDGTILRSELGEERWVTNVPYWIWFDSETFPWLGIPEEADLPVEYEIEYIRVWDKKNLIDSDFFGFEKPIQIDESEQNWFIPAASAAFMSVSEDKAARWYNSLKFNHSGPLPNNVVAFAPFKSVQLETGSFTYSMQIWLEAGADIKTFQVIFEDPWTVLNFDVSGVETGKWVTISQDFKRSIPSGEKDRIRILIKPADVAEGTTTLYFDEIYVNATETLGIDDSKTHEISSKVYPNPMRSGLDQYLNVSSPTGTQLVLYNVTGAEILRMHKTAEPFQIPITALSPGIYFLSIASGTSVETKKIIIK